MKFYSKLFSKVVLFGIVSLSSFMVSNIASPGHGSAATPSNPGYNYNNCVVSTTEFNVVVYVRIEDYLGNTKGYSDNFKFVVDPHFTGSNTTAWNARKKTAIRLWDNGYLTNLGATAQTFQVAMNGNASMPRPQGNICKDTPGAPGVRMPAYAFRDGDWTCHPPFSDTYSSTYPLNTRTAVPGGAGCYPYRGQNTTGAEGNNASRSLSCLELTGTAYTITLNVGSVSPNYVVNADSWTSRQPFKPGGQWLVTQYDYHYDGSGLLNNTSQMAEFVYREPPPIPATVAPHGNINNTSPSSDAAGYIEPGESFNASGTVTASSSTNGGSVNATWRVWYDTDQDFTTVSAIPLTPNVLTNQTTTLTFGAAGGTLAIGSIPNTLLTDPIANSYAYVCSEVIINATSGVPPPVVPAGSNPNKRCLHIERRPYAKVINGDVNAASALSTSCSYAATLPTISTFIKEDGTYRGSGTNIAAFAAGTISQFASGIPPKGLSFANTGNAAANTTYGGGFNGVYCIPDYWAGVTDATNHTVSAVDTSSVFTTGSVLVTGSPSNVTFDLNNNKLRWIVADTIYIDKSVTSLDGIFVAKNKIVTCANGFSMENPASCNVPMLSVNGAFIAGNGIILNRTSGSLLTTAGETFTYTPDTWLQALVPNDQVPVSARGSLGKWQSITMLPPIL